MAEKKRTLCLLSIFMCLLLLFQAMLTVRAEEKEDKRVLFISSYSYAWDTVQLQIEGIKAGLGDGVTLDYEFMDTKRVNDETAEKLFFEGLSYRLSKVAPYDVVILGDDAALIFAAKYQEELFAGIPLVFEGVNDEELAGELAKDHLITGVLEKLSVDKNIELGLRLNPDAKKVVAILDNSITGEVERKRFYKSAESYPELTFTEINASELTSTQLRRELKKVSDDSILIYVVMTEDASGKQYTNKESIRLISDNAAVPALRMVEGGIGEGLLGGNVVSMYKSGEIAANIAVSIAGGRDSGQINVMDSPNIYCVDQLVMNKFGLDMSLLPEGTQIINEQKNFFERNQEAMVPGAMLIIFLIIVILWVCIDNFRRRRLMKELEEARGIMESASQHDFLTGIPNRSKFMEDLETTIASGKPCTIMMIDIDDFKHINDNYGHTAGDDALRELAHRLKQMQSQILTPYRFAGDEFILLIRSEQKKIVEKTAYECRNLFSKSFVLAGTEMKVCGSIGISSYPRDAQDAEQLIINADDAMYEVKKSGKNNFAFYHAQNEK
ncbi:MAG: ABC transporter substrate binding protein [Lachnospiraceae bacterium]|nr:ABC transporter substrate binding protein [Lachnospiraceae bacterium]